MSWNIKTPGDYINGPLTVAGAVTLNSGLTVAGGARFNSTVAVGMTPEKSLNVKTSYVFGLASNGGFKVENYTDTRGLYFEHILGGTILENAYYYGANQFYPTATSSSSISLDSGAVQFYSNTGLTVGSPFLRTEIARITSSGLAVGGVPAGGMLMTVGSTSSLSATANAYQILSNKGVFNIVCDGSTNAAGTTISYSWANGGQGPLIFSRAAGEVARFNPGGTFILGGGNTAADGRGIAFPAAQSASTDANTLDDYEEGTFTPTVFGGTTAGVGTYSVQVGRYTKVGNRVTVDVYLNWTNHTGTGDIRFGGLPFASRNASNYYASMTLGYVSNLAYAANYFLTALVPPNGSSVELSQTATNGGIPVGVPMDTSAAIVFSISYEV